MAKVTTVSDVASISGRLCKNDAVCYAVNKQTGKMHRYDYHGASQPNSEDQQAVKALFKQKARAARNWWNANAAEKNRKGQITKAGSELYDTLIVEYKAQHNIGNPWSYFLSLVDENLKVEIGDTTIQLSADNAGTTSGGSGGSQQGGNIDM